MYEMTLDRLAVDGYEQYEISNFAIPGHERRHNLVYWRNESYLGFGISAASYIDGLRWSNTASTRRYRERVAGGGMADERVSVSRDAPAWARRSCWLCG